MKDYKVSYYLENSAGKMHHSYIVEANTEAEAIQKVLAGIFARDLASIFHSFKIERYYEPWN